MECAASFILWRFEDVIKEHAISLVVPLHQQRFINRKCFIALLAKQTFSADIQVEFFPPIIILFSLYFLFFIIPHILYPSRLDRRFHGRGNALQSSSCYIKSGWPSSSLPSLSLIWCFLKSYIDRWAKRNVAFLSCNHLHYYDDVANLADAFADMFLCHFLSAMLRINIYIMFHILLYEDIARKQPHQVIFLTDLSI